MFRWRISFFLTFTFLASGIAVDGFAHAHELKALAGRFLVPEPGGKTTVYLSWGHALPVDDLVDATSLERYDLIAPDGEAKALKKADLSLQANAVVLKAEGVYQVVAAKKSAVITFVVDADGERQLKRGPKSSVTEGTIDHAARSQQFAKALLVAGVPTAEAPKPLGLPLEIVPVTGPAAWRAGELHFRVLFQSKPVASEQVLAARIGHRPEGTWGFAGETDKQGTVVVPVNAAGTWVISVHVRKPAPAAVRSQYDFEECKATLAIEVRP